MEMVRILGIAVAGTVLAVTLNRHSGGYGLLTGIATGCLLLMVLLGKTGELETALREMAGIGDLSSSYLGRVVRILGLSCLTEAGSRIAKDGGQGNIALKVELCGRVLILCAVLPSVWEVLSSAQTVMSEIGP